MISLSTGIPLKTGVDMMNEAYSIGVIGGADGPTAILIAGRFPWEVLLLSSVLIAAVIWLKKNMK